MTAVFVVEDEPLVAEAHAAIVARLPGFTCAGTAGTVKDAIEALTGPHAVPVDVVLLDLHLPDGNGLQVAAAMRRAGAGVAVLALTADRDLRAVRAALGTGVADYLLKPFTSSVLEQRLRRVSTTRQPPKELPQWRIDHAFETLQAAEEAKGVQPETLDAIRGALGDGGSRSAVEVADLAVLSRATARRYLEHLVTIGEAVRASRYGTPGRPEHEYRLR